MEQHDFEYSYYAPTAEERREIEDIRKQYAPAPAGVSKLEELRRLNRQVTRPPFIISLVLGITGTLILGLGMTMSMEWNMLYGGIAVGAVGLVIAGIAYPVYRAIFKAQKNKYSQRIIELSNELLSENKPENK